MSAKQGDAVHISCQGSDFTFCFMLLVKVSSLDKQEAATMVSAMSSDSVLWTVIVETCLAAALTSALKMARGICSFSSVALKQMSSFSP